jgi:hypothetical protein
MLVVCGVWNYVWHKTCDAMGDCKTTSNTSEKQQTAVVEKPHLKDT